MVYAEFQISFWCFIFVVCVWASVNNDYPSFYTPFTIFIHKPSCLFSLTYHIVTRLLVFVPYRCSPLAYSEEKKRDWHCGGLPPAVVAPSSDKPHLLFYLPEISLWFRFLRYLRDLLPLPTSTTRSSKRGLSPTATTSMPLKAHLFATVKSSSDLSLLATCQVGPTQSRDRNDPSLSNLKHSTARKAATHS